jgi:hypothetical protein
VQVTAPDGRVWTVRRRWLPRYEGRGLKARWAQRPGRRRKDRPSDREGRWYDWIDVPFTEPGWLLLVALAVLLVLGLFFWGLPLLLALVDLLVIFVVVVAGVVGRVVFRRPWTVEATTGDQRLTRHVVGWRRAGDAVQELADELRHGRGGEQPGAHGAGVLP